MKHPSSLSWLGASAALVLCVGAWLYEPPRVESQIAPNQTIFVTRVRTMTPSPAWSPNGQQLIWFDHGRRLYRRGTRGRIHRRGTRGRIYRRSTRGRIYRRSTAARLYRRSTAVRIYRHGSANFVYRRATRSMPSGLSRYKGRRYRRGTAGRILRIRTASVYDANIQRDQLRLLTLGQRRPERIYFKQYTSSSVSAISLFRPRWLAPNLILTSTGFSEDASLITLPAKKVLRLKRLVTPDAHPQGEIIVGRDPQMGVFATTRQAPDQRYALIDERRTIMGYLPRFNPKGDLLAWIDAPSDYKASPLRIYRFPYARGGALTEAATSRVKSPWSWDKKTHPAVPLQSFAIPPTGDVVNFIWSPSGQEIAFVRGQGYTGAGNYRHTSQGLYLLRFRDDKTTLIQIDPKGDHPSFFPDGSLAYHRMVLERSPQRQNTHIAEIVRWDAQTQKQTVIAAGNQPIVSPDGKHIAILRWHPESPTFENTASLHLSILRLP